MKERKLLKMVLCVVVLLGMVVAAQAGTRGVTKDQITVGTHTALSGPVAGWGIDATNGVRMRFDEANEAGGIYGRKIQYIVEDSQYRVPIAVQKANKLVNRDKVFFLIASIGTPMNNAIFPMLEKKDVPNLFPYTAARSMYEPHNRLKFANLAPYYGNVRAGLKYFVEEKGKKRVCMMYQDTDFGLETAEGVKDQLKEMNMTLVAETTHKASETNFVGAINKLRDAKCDVVMLGTIIKDTIIAVSTARKMGWNVDMVGQTAACNYVIPLKGAKGVEGLYAVTSIPIMYEDQATGKAKVFFENYKKRFGKAPSEVAQQGYFSADLAVIALEKAGKDLTVDSFIKALESIQGYHHPFGGPVVNFGPEKHLGSNESVLLQIKNGKWVPPSGQKQVLAY
ncbi:MAG TPA: ABC transporter substrate-binding protein [Desulfobacteria bacterium]|nr:ABC transporter substrate-binding protein [Desulfobacteria bacterium]